MGSITLNDYQNLLDYKSIFDDETKRQASALFSLVNSRKPSSIESYQCKLVAERSVISATKQEGEFYEKYFERLWENITEHHQLIYYIPTECERLKAHSKMWASIIENLITNLEIIKSDHANTYDAACKAMIL